ncbi:hypothetical protein QFW77_05550 [Luteimonas sp. RD2P54]|uniref:L,D-transpeptidase n=1 Tax=Luteimonas endophytica TaxID=3042023 RepID=A0ABT6J6S1_9GAMM|nr:hypothetical protein [Luteimonas endophytica]MDH5822454.1 hypothetical protein [Luteimonas endophytica]
MVALIGVPASLAVAVSPQAGRDGTGAPHSAGAAGHVGGERAALQPRLARFQQQPVSPEVRHIAHWALDSGDNGGLPYLIIDKAGARVFVFDASGRLQGAGPALLGMGVGDVAVEGLGALRLAAIRPQDRITPAGRFVASLDRDLKGQEIMWIDYDDALALHRVAKGQPSERRAERLQSPTVADNRISYGCINVPVRFYEEVVSPAFQSTGGVVYILPEVGQARDLFGSYDVRVAAEAGEMPR